MLAAELDNAVRLHIYHRFVDTAAAPTIAETAVALERPEGHVERAYRRLEQARVIVLAPGTANVWMANPFSAVPTPFRVSTEGGTYWGNCVWDALGIPALLGVDGRVKTSCQDCGEAIELVVEDGALQPADAVAHFAVPAARWWENIGFT